MSGAHPIRSPSRPRLGDELGGVGGFRGQRLLGVDVLARREAGADDGHVRAGWSQIEDDVDRRVADELVHGRDPEVVGLGQRFRLRPIEVGAGDELEGVEGLRARRVLAADHAAADDADTRWRVHAAASATIAVRASNERRAASSDGPSVSSCSTSSHSAPASTAAGATRS